MSFEYLVNKVALVRGSANGIGLDTVRLLAEMGSHVVVVDLDAKVGRRVAEDMKQAGGEAIFIQADVARSDDGEKMVDTVVECFSRLD